MMRKEGWEDRLAELLDGAVSRHFKWGEWDCCLMAASCVEALTGEDPALAYRGRYATSDQAAQLMALDFGAQPGPAGVREVLALIAAGNGWEEIPILAAQRGDLVMGPAGPDGTMAAGVVSMDGRYAAFPGAGGLLLLPIRACAAGWRIT